MRAGIYGRLSVARPQGTQDPKGNGQRTLETSTDRQVGDCHAWVQRHDGEIARTYRDEGISGYTGTARPDFERLLADLADGAIDTVVCWKLDRLARNHRDFQRLWEACETAKARLVSLHELFDSSTPAGEFVIRMMVGMAKMESDTISLRVKRATRALREVGRLHTGGAHPFGHTWDGSLIPAEAAVIRWAALRVLAGHGLIPICRDLAARGITGTRGRPIRPRGLKAILCSGRVAGLVEHQREIIGPGAWTPILQRATWEQVRVVLHGPARAQERRPVANLLAGFLVCGVQGCGAKLTSRPAHGRRCYVCVATGRLHLSVAAAAVEDLVAEMVLERLGHGGLARVLGAQAGAGNTRALGAQLVALDAKLRSLGDDYGDETIDKPTYLRQRARVTERLAKLGAQLDRLVARRQLAGVPTGPGRLRGWWTASSTTIGQRRAVLQAVLERVVVSPSAGPGRTLDPARIDPARIVWRA